MKRLVIALGVVGVVVLSLSAQTAPPSKRVFGAGATLCSVSMGTDKVVEQGNGVWSVEGGPKDPAQVSWLLGYLSAAGVTGKAAEPNGEYYALGWISAKCGSQPNRTIAEVAADFVTAHQ